MASAAKKPRAKTKVVSKKKSNIPPFVTRFLANRRVLAVVAIALFASVGTSFILWSRANPSDEMALLDRPDRGQVYGGQRVKTSGPCEGQFDITPSETREHGGAGIQCGHFDPLPEGEDIRERAKHVEQETQAMADYDATNAPTASSDPSDGQEFLPAATISRGSMAGLGTRNWPCVGTGTDGARVRAIYVYPSNGTNRLPGLRDDFSAIARRMNNIMYYSGKESGRPHQIRFATNNGDTGCVLGISAEPVAASVINESGTAAFTDLKEILQNRGYKSLDRKYLVWVDGGVECGFGDRYPDTVPTQANGNNTQSYTYTTSDGYSVPIEGAMFAIVWKGCWNYGEPHELMHALGAVQRTAPYDTGAMHCRDNHDVMCYNDGGPTASPQIAPCTETIQYWRYDCRHDTYFKGVDPTSGWLSTHWNTANSRFLTR